MSKVSVVVERTSYPVVGASRREVLDSIDKNGPERKGQKFAAYTEWEISWDFAIQPARRKGQEVFTIANPSVQAKVLVTLPVWKAPSNAPESLRTSWQRASKALQHHEADHVAFALAAGERVLRRLMKLGPLKAADRSAVDDVMRAEIGKIQLDERSHDKKTKHGLTQGTYL